MQGKNRHETVSTLYIKKLETIKKSVSVPSVLSFKNFHCIVPLYRKNCCQNCSIYISCVIIHNYIFIIIFIKLFRNFNVYFNFFQNFQTCKFSNKSILYHNNNIINKKINDWTILNTQDLISIVQIMLFSALHYNNKFYTYYL